MKNSSKVSSHTKYVLSISLSVVLLLGSVCLGMGMHIMLALAAILSDSFSAIRIKSL